MTEHLPCLSESVFVNAAMCALSGACLLLRYRFSDVENSLKLCDGDWGPWEQKGCFSVNSMRELSNLPLEARELMIASAVRIRRGLVRNLSGQAKGALCTLLDAPHISSLWEF